jgi:hypothetical protein
MGESGGWMAEERADSIRNGEYDIVVHVGPERQREDFITDAVGDRNIIGTTTIFEPCEAIPGHPMDTTVYSLLTHVCLERGAFAIKHAEAVVEEARALKTIRWCDDAGHAFQKLIVEAAVFATVGDELVKLGEL